MVEAWFQALSGKCLYALRALAPGHGLEHRALTPVSAAEAPAVAVQPSHQRSDPKSISN